MQSVETVQKAGGVKIVRLFESDEDLIEETARLYCEIWREPPWEEDFWTVEGVVDDIRRQLANQNAVLMIGINGKGVVGFTWGYEVSLSQACEMCGHEVSDRFPPGARPFYIDELAVASGKRERGLGYSLSLDCLSEARSHGLNCGFLRTDIGAIPAKRVYSKLGFEDSFLPDPKYPHRTYWFLKRL